MKKPVKKQVTAADANKRTKPKAAVSPKKAAAVSPKKVAVAKTVAKNVSPVKTAAKAAPKKKKKEEDDEEEMENGDDFLLPGQTKATPDESDPLRIFYESLYKQRPGSKMAEEYCL